MNITLTLAILACVGLRAHAVITGQATCDNKMYLYADGVQEAHNTDWTVASSISIPDNTQVVAVKCVDNGGVGGIKVALGNGVKTDSTWTCSANYEHGWNEPGFDDKDWTPAMEHSVQHWGTVPTSLNEKAAWIWTPGPKGQDTTVYCRKVMKTQAHAVITGQARCDDKMDFYADAHLRAHTDKLEAAQSISIPDNTQVVGVKCVDTGGVGSIDVALSNGVKSDSTWKCSARYELGWNTPGFDDTHWKAAVEHAHTTAVHPVYGHFAYIWTAGNRGEDKTVYCRKVLGCNCCEKLKKIADILN